MLYILALLNFSNAMLFSHSSPLVAGACLVSGFACLISQITIQIMELRR